MSTHNVCFDGEIRKSHNLDTLPWSPCPRQLNWNFLLVLREMGQAGQARHGISTELSLLFFTMCIDNTVPLTDRPWQLVSPCYHWKLKEAQEKHENFDWSHSLRKRLFVLRFYGPVHPMGSCRAWSVYLTTLSLSRLRPSSSYTVIQYCAHSFARKGSSKTMQIVIICKHTVWSDFAIRHQI